MAMTAVITEPEKVQAEQEVKINCNADDDEILLVDWLGALLYEMDVRKMLFSRYEVTIKDENLQAIAWGEKCDRKKHQPAVEIKGVTYTCLSVREDDDGLWSAQCVVDV